MQNNHTQQPTTSNALSKQDVVIPSDNHSYTKEQIREIQTAIEKGLILYKSKMEIFSVLKNVDTQVVNMVWQKLEQNNPRFFTAYLIRVAVIKQIKVYNQLIREQAQMMRTAGLPQQPDMTTPSHFPSPQLSYGGVQSPYIQQSPMMQAQTAFQQPGLVPNAYGQVPPSYSQQPNNAYLTNPLPDPSLQQQMMAQRNLYGYPQGAQQPYDYSAGLLMQAPQQPTQPNPQQNQKKPNPQTEQKKTAPTQPQGEIPPSLDAEPEIDSLLGQGNPLLFENEP